MWAIEQHPHSYRVQPPRSRQYLEERDRICTRYPDVHAHEWLQTFIDTRLTVQNLVANQMAHEDGTALQDALQREQPQVFRILDLPDEMLGEIMLQYPSEETLFPLRSCFAALRALLLRSFIPPAPT